MAVRNHTIDLLRILAATWVFLFHLNDPLMYTYFSYDAEWMGVQSPYRSFTQAGGAGVFIFFVISGYCIALAAQHSKGAADFWVRRLFRIFPAYWFSLLVVLGTVGFYVAFLGQNSVTPLPKTPGEAGATMLLLTTPFSTMGTINWVYWSLTVELFFYLVAGLSLLLPAAGRTLFLLLLSGSSFLPGVEAVPGLFFLPFWAPFGLGWALYALSRPQPFRPLFWLLLLVNAGSLFYRHGTDSFTLASLASAAVIALSIFYKDLPQNRLSRAGDYAYGLYLLHVPVGVYLLGLLISKAIQASLPASLTFDAAVLTVLLLLAALLFHYLEAPGIRLGKRLAGRRSPAAQPLTTV